jgi:hypothetical protein
MALCQEFWILAGWAHDKAEAKTPDRLEPTCRERLARRDLRSRQARQTGPQIFAQDREAQIIAAALAFFKARCRNES